MKHGAAAWLLAAIVCPVIPQCVHAQEGSSNAEAQKRTILGFGFGGGTIPAAFYPTCSAGEEGWNPAAAVDGRLGVSFGSIRLESSTAAQAALVIEDCLYLGRAGQDGIETIKTSPLEPGELVVVTNVRVSHTSGSVKSQWLVFAGVGWTWAHDIPVQLIGGGLRLGGTIRLALDAEVSRYRIPWDVITAEWRDRIVVRELDRRREHDWQSGLTLRLGLEIQR